MSLDVDGSACDAPDRSPTTKAAPLVMWALYSLLIASSLSVCLLIGSRREAALKAKRAARNAMRVLGYGDKLSGGTDGRDVGRTTLAGVTPSQGKWQLLVFVERGCEPCGMLLKSLVPLASSASGSLDIRPVVVGAPIVGAADSAARDYMRTLGVPFAPSVDQEWQFHDRFDRSPKTPISVLSDPSGLIRYVGHGFMPSGGGSSELADNLSTFFLAPQNAGEALGARQGKPCPHAAVKLDHHERTSVAALSKRKTLIVTFLTDDSNRSMRRLDVCRRYASAPGMGFLFVARRRSIAPVDITWKNGFMISSQDTDPVFAAFGIDRGPVSLIVRDGVLLGRESEPQESGEGFETELAKAALLSSARSLSVGNGVGIAPQNPNAERR